MATYFRKTSSIEVAERPKWKIRSLPWSFSNIPKRATNLKMTTTMIVTNETIDQQRGMERRDSREIEAEDILSDHVNYRTD